LSFSAYHGAFVKTIYNEIDVIKVSDSCSQCIFESFQVGPAVGISILSKIEKRLWTFGSATTELNNE
jgi:hypothetical protein